MLLFSRVLMPCCAMSWVYSCLLLILINIIVGTVSGCRAILKTRRSTIAYKNKSDQYNWHQDSKLSLLVACVEFRGTSLPSAPKDGTDTR